MTTCPSCSSSNLTSIPGAGARAAYLCVTCARRFVDGDDSPASDSIDAIIAAARRDLVDLAADDLSCDDNKIRLFELLDHTTTSLDATYPRNLDHLPSLLPLASSFPPSPNRACILRDLGDVYIVDFDTLLSWLHLSLYPPPTSFSSDTATDDRAVLFISPHNGVSVLGVALSPLTGAATIQ